ncbi:MAG TPA: DsrE family protein [Bacteroidales bacterium]|nr:DsrE family protein [Bacteroidales bacterium]
MKATLLFSLALILIISGCKNNVPENADNTFPKPKNEATQVIKDGVFIHITQSYDDPHRVLMPLKMATLMAEDKDVIVYLDIHAVEFLVKEAKDIQYADFESAHTYIKMLQEKNVGVYACPACLKIAGFGPDDLIDGVQTAEKDKFFNFTQGRILTLDY